MPIALTCSNCGVVKTFKPSQAAKRQGTLCRRCYYQSRHGCEKHPLYRVWHTMLYRIDHAREMKKNTCYIGLDVAPEWRDVRTFIAWAVENGWEPGWRLSIERRDNTRGYWPDNCRWIPLHLQNRNKRSNTLTQALVDEIRARVAAGEFPFRVAKAIATREGIKYDGVRAAAYGENWK